MKATAFLNGAFVPLEEARVSVLDRGFLFGDGVYEVVPVYGRRPFRLPRHLDRLDDSLAAIGIPNPLARPQWHELVTELIERNPAEDQSVYLQVTRGVSAQRDHAFPAGVTPTLFAMSQPFPEQAPAVLERGISAVTLPDIRWHACHIKAVTLLANVLARQEALDAGSADAILIRAGYATEGTASNLFVVQDGLVTTPPKGELLLPGITRDLILELLRESGGAYREAPVAESELALAQEIFLSSSTREIVPVTRLNDRPVGSGRPGDVFARVMDLFRAHKAAFRAGQVA
jgi:D-alanine transaminase